MLLRQTIFFYFLQWKVWHILLKILEKKFSESKFSLKLVGLKKLRIEFIIYFFTIFHISRFFNYSQHWEDIEASMKATSKIFGYILVKAASSNSTMMIGNLEFSIARRRRSNFIAATFVAFFRSINKQSRASWICWISSSLGKIIRR